MKPFGLWKENEVAGFVIFLQVFLFMVNLGYVWQMLMIAKQSSPQGLEIGEKLLRK